MKKVLIGFVLGISMTLTTHVFADLDAKITNLIFKVNGETKQVDSPVLNVNGSTYLPLRDVANILGYSVEYNANTKTVEFNNNSTITSDNKNQENNIVEITFNNYPAINVNGEIYFLYRPFAIDTENRLKKEGKQIDFPYNAESKEYSIVIDGNVVKVIKVTDENTFIYNGQTYFHQKLYEEY